MFRRAGKPARVLASIATIGLLTGIGTSLGTGTAAADIKYSFDFSGVAHVKKAKADAKFGPADFTANLNASTGEFTGDWEKLKSNIKFKGMGMIDVSTDMAFVPLEPAKGKITKDGHAEATLKLDVYLTSVKIMGGVPIPVEKNCKTTKPVTMKFSGDNFNPLKGGKLSAAPWELPGFSKGCGIAQPFADMWSSGPGNTTDIELKAKGS